MGIAYPTNSDGELTDEELQDPEVSYADFASDWSETWVVEVYAGDPEDDDVQSVLLGPLPPREAWDLANELDQRRPEWVFAVVPVFEPEDPDSLVERLESDD